MINDLCQPWKFGSKRDSMIRSTCLNCLEAQCWEPEKHFANFIAMVWKKKELKKFVDQYTCTPWSQGC